MYHFAGYLIKVNDNQFQHVPNKAAAIGFCRQNHISETNIETCYRWDKLQSQFTTPDSEDIIKED